MFQQTASARSAAVAIQMCFCSVPRTNSFLRVFTYLLPIFDFFCTFYLEHLHFFKFRHVTTH